MIAQLNTALAPLVAIAKAYDANNLDDEARRFWGVNNENENTTHPKDLELFSGRGGAQLLTLDNCQEARAAQQSPSLDRKISALRVMVTIARAWDANELDDEARKFYGQNLEHRTETDPGDIILVSSRGGAPLLTLAHCLEGRYAHHAALHGVAA